MQETRKQEVLDFDSKMLSLSRETATSLNTGFKLALFSLARYNEALKTLKY